jgi:hypothetical protein
MKSIRNFQYLGSADMDPIKFGDRWRRDLSRAIFFSGWPVCDVLIRKYASTVPHSPQPQQPTDATLRWQPPQVSEVGPR